MAIQGPYLLFVGDATDPLSIKMAQSAAYWTPQNCVGEFRLPGNTASTGLSALSIAEAASQGAKSFVLGFANSGGNLDASWHPHIIAALEAGMDVVSGLHDRLTDIPDIQKKADELGRRLIDIRHPTTRFKTGKGIKRTGKRLLTVGTDCSVGKMFTSLAISRELASRGVPSDFRATGQSGILVSGAGIAVDCVISDFISGAVETLSPDAADDHWDIIEGQGSLSHPAFAGVSLGLLHGSQPDALVICHAMGRDHMRALPHQPQPSIAQTIELNLLHARLTNPDVAVAGISVNTSSVDEATAKEYCASLSEQFGLPCVDPHRHGVSAIVDALV